MIRSRRAWQMLRVNISLLKVRRRLSVTMVWDKRETFDDFIEVCLARIFRNMSFRQSEMCLANLCQTNCFETIFAYNCIGRMIYYMWYVDLRMYGKIVFYFLKHFYYLNSYCELSLQSSTHSFLYIYPYIIRAVI